MINENYYEILELEKKASSEEIKKSFRKLSLKYHPDINKDADSSDKFRRIKEAYDCLIDNQKRFEYDKGMSFKGRAFNFETNITNFSKLNKDIHKTIIIDIFNAHHGCDIDLEINPKSICIHCGGDGYEEYEECKSCDGEGKIRKEIPPFFVLLDCEVCYGKKKVGTKKCNHCDNGMMDLEKEIIPVKIPAGVNDYVLINYSKHGNLISNTRGDLIIRVKIKEHDVFKLSGSDIYTNQEITYAKLLLGGEITIETLEGKKEIILPELMKISNKIKLKNVGMRILNTDKRGDQFVSFSLKMPTKLSKDHKECLSILNSIETNNI